MAQIKSLAELTTADGRALRFTPLGFSTGGTLKPEDAAQFQQQMIAHCDLHPDVPEGTRNSFERLRTLHCYGILCYEAFTVADDLAWLLLEQALRERFVEFFNGHIPMANPNTGEERPIVASNFDMVDGAFRSGGSHVRGSWQLKLTTGAKMNFRGTMSQLQDWARQEHLLDGQRNKRLDPVYVAMRNSVAHPHYHLSMPPDSARTIRDLAEIINRLWGQLTPGGRLYPAPLDRQVLIVAWTDAEEGTTTILRDFQLASFNEPGDWMCVVVLGVLKDEGLWDFSAQYERTYYPADLLWGPGRPEDALTWMNGAQPEVDTVSYIDRLFAVRIHEGKVSLARRPEGTLTLPPDSRIGRWLVIRADFPNDAFAHGRHIKDGVTCGVSSPISCQPQPPVAATSTPSPNCAVEAVFDGKWDDMVSLLVGEFCITKPSRSSTARVRPRFSSGVAPDVEAD